MASCTCANPTQVSDAIGDAARQSGKNATLIDETLYGKSMGGSHGSLGPLKFCHWAAPEVSAVGENAASKVWEAVTIAIALANTVAQGYIAEKQQDLAESYYSMAKFKWDRFASQYIPLELKLLNEVSTEPIRKLDCAGARSRAVQSVDGGYEQLEQLMARWAKAFRVCIDPALVDVVNTKQAIALVDTVNYNLLDDQFFTDYSNDKRWDRRSTVLNLGRNMSTEAMKYGDFSSDLFNQSSDRLNKFAGNAMYQLGYYGARNDTYYPTTYMDTGPAIAGRGGGATVSMTRNQLAGNTVA